MHKPIIYVDGQEGTTGLQIHERLQARGDLEVLKIDPDKRKDNNERARLINAADLVFLCLPDAASKEAVGMITNTRTRVIDASTAFRTDPAWVYGFPELNSRQREKIRTARFVANPGCHATGFIAAVHPLVAGGIIAADYPLSATSITGYSGAGKKMIEAYEVNPADKLAIPRPYALGLTHKHLPEMQKVAGLSHPPVFYPVICDFYKGMAVSVPLFPGLFQKKMKAADLQKYLADFYQGEHFVRVQPYDLDVNTDGGFLPVTADNGTNYLDLFVFGHDDQMILVARLDNLGKGASGAAVQNMNIMLGLVEASGLEG